MSTGIVICSSCRREAHQWGEPSSSARYAVARWVHCDDRTPLCPGATGIYPSSTAEIVGRWCGSDGEPSEVKPTQPMRRPTRPRRIHQFPKKLFASFRNPTR